MVFGIQSMYSQKNELSLLSFSEIILKKYRIWETVFGDFIQSVWVFNHFLFNPLRIFFQRLKTENETKVLSAKKFFFGAHI